MARYILTGAPGCGKTSIIRALEMKGYFVIEEAATDVIAYEQALGNLEPWKSSSFVDKIIYLQKQRQQQVDATSSRVEFYDRSPFCTYALAMYLSFEPPPSVMEAIAQIQDRKLYKKRVFFIENLGFIKHTDARKISYEDALRFEEIHRNVYIKFGYEIVKILPAPLLERVANILSMV